MAASNPTMYPGQSRRSGFTRKASLVFYVLDDFTGRPVPEKCVFVQIPGMKAPIRKNEGYYVFMDLEDGDYTVYINGDQYCQTVLEDVKVREDQECPVITVRMMPGPRYRLPQDTARITGEAKPYSFVCAIFKPESGMQKLLYDYDGGQLIRIFTSDTKSLDGRSFCIQNKEFFTIRNTINQEERVYLMDHELKNTYKRGKTKLYSVLWTQADEDGKFFLAIYGIGENGLECSVGLGKEKKKLQKVTVHAQETTNIQVPG